MFFNLPTTFFHSFLFYSRCRYQYFLRSVRANTTRKNISFARNNIPRLNLYPSQVLCSLDIIRLVYLVSKYPVSCKVNIREGASTSPDVVLDRINLDTSTSKRPVFVGNWAGWEGERPHVTHGVVCIDIGKIRRPRATSRTMVVERGRNKDAETRY